MQYSAKIFHILEIVRLSQAVLSYCVRALIDFDFVL